MAGERLLWRLMGEHTFAYCSRLAKLWYVAPMGLSRRTWIGLILVDVVIWLIADSQDTALLALKAHGAFLTVLQVLWVLSLFGFILLVLFGVVALVVQSRRSRAR
jgi:hypothetical protein